jgi:hypothetical protein
MASRGRHDADKRPGMASGASTRHLPKSQRGRARTNKSCGPDVRWLASSPAVMRAARPGPRISHPRRRRGQQCIAPRGEHEGHVNTIAQGRPGVPARPVVHPRVHSFGTRTRVPAGARPSLRPCHDEGETRSKTRAKDAARMRRCVCCLKGITERRPIMPHSRCHRPRRRTIQYSAAGIVRTHWRRGVLDAPPARGMTPVL